MRPETVTEAPKPPEVTKNPARGQVCAHSTSSVTLLPSQTTLLIRPQKREWILLLLIPKLVQTFATAQAHVVEASFLYLTADQISRQLYQI